MSAFARFKNKSTHAQPVETKDGWWEENADRVNNPITFLKGASVLLVAGSITAGVMLAIPILGQVAGIGIFAYGFAASIQGYYRAQEDNDEKTPHGYAGDPSHGQVIKNTLKYLIKPF